MADYKTVPGAQVTGAEREFIKQAAERVAAGKEKPLFLNIGIMWGCTLWCLRAGAPKSVLVAVDIAPQKWKIADREALNVHIIKGDSRKLWKSFNVEQPIDLLLIDGDHHYATVKADIAGWVDKCKGTLIFHDYAPTPHNMKQFPHLEGVKRAVDEWFETAVGWKSVEAPDSLRAFIYEN